MSSPAYRGVTLVDGTVYCPAIAKRKDLLDPKGELDNGNITEEQFALAIAQRKRLQLDIKEVTSDGTVRFSCPALSGKVACPLRKNDTQATKQAAKKGAAGNPALPLSSRQVPSQKSCGDLCRQKSVSIAVNDPDAVRFSKYHQQGPAAYTDEWKALYKVYRVRNEGANAIIKAESGIGLGDRTKKGMRGFNRRGASDRTGCGGCQRSSGYQQYETPARQSGTHHARTGRASTRQEARGGLYRIGRTQRTANTRPHGRLDQDRRPCKGHGLQMLGEQRKLAGSSQIGYQKRPNPETLHRFRGLGLNRPVSQIPAGQKRKSPSSP